MTHRSLTTQATVTRPPAASARSAAPGPIGGVCVALAVAEAMLAIAAFAGAFGLITGSIDLGKASEDLPYASPTLGGLALAVLCGVLPTGTVLGTLRRSRWAAVGHLCVGITLIGWIAVQVAYIGLGSWLQITYALYGMAIVGLAVINLRSART